MLKLYHYELSGNCYKLRLLMGILGLPFESHQIDFYPGREHEQAWFLRINPLGQVPVIEDDGLVLRDSQAILMYLAAKYDPGGRWFPREDPAMLGKVAMWLSFADAINGSSGAARLHDGMGFPFDVEACRARAHRQFRILEEHLWFAEQEGQPWICSVERPTIADIACFPYVVLAEEGGISLLEYPTLRRWTDRVKRIPGFTVMPGIFPASAAA